MRYALHRIRHSALVLIGVSFLTFAFSALAPGNYFDDLRLNPQIPAERVNSLRAQYQIDRPISTRYLRWLVSIAKGDFGFSFAYNSAVAPLVWSRARNTLVLTVTATLFTWLLALPLGIWSAARINHSIDRTLSAIAAMLLIVPDLAIALGFLLLAVRTRWLPTGGMASIGSENLSVFAKAWDSALHLLLPVTVLVLSALPIVLRHTRAAVAEVLTAPFIRAAEMHGVSRTRLLFRYALPAAAHPLITLFGFSVGTLISSSLLVEIVLSWPGLGPLLLDAILSRDLYLVIGGVLLSTLFLIGGSLLADLLLYLADPRIRAERVQ